MDKTIVNHISPSKVTGRLATLHRVLEEAGLTYDDLQKPIDDSSMRQRLVRFWQLGGHEPSIEQKLAQEIMAKNYIGPEVAIKDFGVKFIKKDNGVLAKVPFSEAVLRECKNSHILVLVPKLSILDIRSKVEQNLFYSHEDAWYNNEKFAKNKGEVMWQLVRKTPVPNSTLKNWEEQQSLLSGNEEASTSRIMVYTIISYYKATGERLFKKFYVRCSDLSSDGRRVHVGYFDSDGLYVGNHWDDRRHDHLGLSASRKLNLET